MTNELTTVYPVFISPTVSQIRDKKQTKQKQTPFTGPPNKLAWSLCVAVLCTVY